MNDRVKPQIMEDDDGDSIFDTASTQEERLALQLCQISELLQHERLEVMEGLSDVYHNPVLGVVKVKCDFLLRHRNVKDEIDLNVWKPDDESFMVKVYTRSEWRDEERKQAMQRNIIMALIFLLFNAGFIIARLKGWI